MIMPGGPPFQNQEIFTVVWISLKVVFMLISLEGAHRILYVLVGDARSSLVKHCALRGLKDDVVARIAFVELDLNFAVEIVFFVLSLPVAVREVESIEQSAVHDNAGFGT